MNATLRHGGCGAALAIAALSGAFVGARHVVYKRAEASLLVTKAMGTSTPRDAGMPFTPRTVASGDRRLRAWWIPASPGRDDGAAVLIVHGRGEAISDWIDPLKILHDGGVAIYIFDYSGFGESTGRATGAHLRQDVRAAFGDFLALAGGGGRRFAMGLSLGTGFLLDVAPDFQKRLDGVILVGSYSSARDAAVQTRALPRALTWLLPDVYDNVEAVERIHVPLLLIHSDADETFPIWMPEKVFAAAHRPKTLALLHGLAHDSLLHGHAAEILAPAVGFMNGTIRPD